MNISKVIIKTEERTEFIDVTDKINEKVDVENGWLSVFTKHTTSGLTINENEERLISDMEKVLKEIVKEKGWKHNEIDNNADSHLRGMLLDSNLVIPVRNGSLDLGTWQSIFFVELDGPRTRNILISSFN